MWSLEVLAVGYARSYALLRTAKIYSVVRLGTLDDTIKAEQPSPANATSTPIAPRVPTICVR
jgi:hypothetical protein